MRFTFNGYRDGTDDISDDELLGLPGDETYPILQDKIVQQAHSFEFGYDITRWASIYLMVPYIRQMSDHHANTSLPPIADGFEDFTIYSDGVGDVSLVASFRALDLEHHILVATAGLSFPSGSITERAIRHSPAPRINFPIRCSLAREPTMSF